MTFRDALRALSEDTEAKVLAVYAALEAGAITHDEAVAAVAALVAKGNARAASLADLALSASLTAALRKPVATLGLSLPQGEPARLHKAARTLLSIDGVTPERVARLGRAEPLETGQRTYADGMARSASVTGWVRSMDGNPCQLCRWWHRDGRVWPADHPFQTHKGCSCTASLVTVDRVAPTQYTRKARLEREAVANTRRFAA